MRDMQSDKRESIKELFLWYQLYWQVQSSQSANRVPSLPGCCVYIAHGCIQALSISVMLGPSLCSWDK